jgi:hypothetical protein
MSNYPDTTGPNDPNAPWNQKDLPDFKAATLGVCAECQRGEDDVVEVDSDFICKVCFELAQESDA